MAVLHRLSLGDEVPGDAVLACPAEHGVRGELGAMVGDDHHGPPPAGEERRERATRLPEIDVPATAARHSLVTSSMTFRMRKRSPQATTSAN